jgi:NADH/NAD ratio-sensing transcriptional regulator Rex
MYKTAIIGSGQLGSCHLQGIKIANLELSIIFFFDIKKNNILYAKRPTINKLSEE